MTATGTARDTSGSQLYKYGFWVVMIGITAVLVAFLLSLARLSASGDAATAASAMSAAIGTLASAYFGYHAGSAGKQGRSSPTWWATRQADGTAHRKDAAYRITS